MNYFPTGAKRHALSLLLISGVAAGLATLPPTIAEDKADQAAVKRTRKQALMLDDLYKTATTTLPRKALRPKLWPHLRKAPRLTRP